ncbi:MAG: helix-turn-helix domain-containing protein [bacterium]|nr:helix-turn-helix domain-containing protein [bacterium]MDD5353952.1 helix-turn-helix domain-containing protein [bacterium]MDD5756223.1 helix-turn-helix domain-containing protein [bacterium]
MITVLIAENEKKIQEIVSQMLKAEGYGVVEEKSGVLYKTVMAKVEKQLVDFVLEQTEGNQLKTARILGINRNTLRTKIKKLGIDIMRWKEAR